MASSKTSARTPIKSSAKDSPAPAKGRSSKPAGKQVVSKPTDQFYRRFSKDTSGTFRFEAVSLKTGKPLSQDDKDAHVTQIYVRKSSKALRSSDPQFLRITIEELDMLPAGAVVEADDDEDAA